MTTNMRVLLCTGLLIIAALTACDFSSPPPATFERLVSESIFYADTEKQQQFQNALVEAGVPYDSYTGADGKRYIRWRGEYSETVKRIQVALFGEPLPQGRSIHFGAKDHERFKTWLTENRIPFSTQVRDGREFVVWTESDYPRVAQWNDFPRETFEKMHRGEPLPQGNAIHFGAPDQERFKRWLSDNRIPFQTQVRDGKEFVVWAESDYSRVAQWNDFPRDTFDKMHRLSPNRTVDTDARKSGVRGSP